ncbi:T9SS type B sorting domain-containing protein [Flavobacterium suzhouense]|uniref:Gliding motility-associated C-terminal domain-containing protein n=1 Tax=Flavobacterium suzhouense TaxID=1529638 RepID=A0ABW5NR52_9FLAO
MYTITADATQCIDGGTFTATIELVAGVTPVTTFSYEESYCNGSANAFPDTVADFTAGGTFTSTTGLVINATTGEINVANSTPGTYTVVYTIEADADTCNAGGSHSFTLTIAGGLEAEVSQECRDNNSWVFVTAVNGSFDAEAASYVWKDESGATVGTDAGLNLTAYAVANASEELPLTFTVTITSGDCSSEIMYEIYNIMCDVQRGISPNGDGMNDNLDLTGTGVKSVVIFNRYGKKVFEHGLGYTPQWHGQDNSGNELPDGTYFYSIENGDGSNKTGWIYINK